MALFPRRRRTYGDPDAALTASGQRVSSSQAESLRRVNQPWQERAFSYYDLLGEIKYASQFYSQGLGKIEIYAAEINEHGETVPTNEARAKEALDRIQDPGGGRSGLLGAYGRLSFLIGEATLFVTHGEDEEEQWEMLSKFELRPSQTGHGYVRYRAPMLTPEEYTDAPDDVWDPVNDDEAVAYRLWQRHPKYSALADSTMRGVLDTCEELVSLTLSIRSQLRSRLAGAGILLIDERVAPRPPKPQPGGDPVVDEFLRDLTSLMMRPINEEGVAAAIVPLIVRVPALADEKVRVEDLIHHLRLVERDDLFREIGLRIECVRRLAISLDMPPERLLGLGDTNHWNAWEIDEQAWKLHLEPKAKQLCDDLTASYYRPTLKDAGLDPRKYLIAYDPAGAVTKPDRSKDAKDVYKLGGIGGMALRRETGFDEADAMTDEETRVWLSVNSRDPGLGGGGGGGGGRGGGAAPPPPRRGAGRRRRRYRRGRPLRRRAGSSEPARRAERERPGRCRARDRRVRLRALPRSRGRGEPDPERREEASRPARAPPGGPVVRGRRFARPRPSPDARPPGRTSSRLGRVESSRRDAYGLGAAAGHRRPGRRAGRGTRDRDALLGGTRVPAAAARELRLRSLHACLMPVKPLPPSTLNSLVRRGMKRAEEIEPHLVAAIQPLLNAAGDEAARQFERYAVPLTAAARSADRTALSRIDPADAAGLGWTLALRAAAPNGNSTMVCVKPTLGEARDLADPNGDPADYLHVTLAYLGEIDGPLDAIVEVLAAVAATHGPLSGTIGGVGHFSTEDSGTPAILLPDVPGLVELRVAVTDALVDGGIDYARGHGFTPHVTTGYVDRPATGDAGKIGKPLTFENLFLVRGDRIDVIPIPLTGRPPLTAGAVVAATDVGKKIGEVAAEHAPDGGYGDTYWNAGTGKVFWVCGDWTSVDEAAAAETDFLAIDEVTEFEACWECAAPEGDEWEKVYGSSAMGASGDPFLDDLVAAMMKPIAEDDIVPAVSFFTVRGAAGDPPPWGSPAANEVVDVDELVGRFRGKTDPVRRAMIETVMTPALEEAGLDWDVTNPFTARVLEQSGSQIVHIAETTQLNVMKIIAKSYDQGLSIRDTAKAIRVGMREEDTERATLIARTEMTGAVNGGSLAATQIVADATKTTYEKEWLTAHGAKYPRHEEYVGLNGQRTTLDGLFTVGSAQLQYPGDPSGPPHEICNCRCALAYAESQTPKTEPLVQPRDPISVGAGPPLPATILQKIFQLKLDGWPPTQSPFAREVLDGNTDTLAEWKHGGEWSAERKRLHDDIVASHFEGKEASGELDYYFTAGGGGSGKSRATFRVGDEDVGLEDLAARRNVVAVDPDRIKTMLPEYQRLIDANDPYAASAVHEESSEIAKRVAAEAEKRGLSVLLDSTGSSSSFVSKLEAAKAAGYDVQVTMFSIRTNEAIVRAVRRGDRSGRYVAITPLKKAHAGASRDMAIWKDAEFVDEWKVYDNSGVEPTLVASGGHGTETVLDPGLFDEILAKATE